MKPLVILDAGHGITTAGKRSPFTLSQLSQWMREYPYMFGEEPHPEPHPNPPRRGGSPTPPKGPSAAQEALPFGEGLGGAIVPSAAQEALPFGEGWGGASGGAHSCLMEWKLNRDIARRTQQLLLEMDYDSRLLVPEDADLPLRERVARARAMCQEHEERGGIWPNRLLVSIHCNASGKPHPHPEPHPNPPRRGGSPTSPKGPSAAQEALPFGEGWGGAGGAIPSSFTHPSGWECHVSGRSYNARQLAGELYKQAFECLPKCFPVRGLRGVIPRDTLGLSASDFASQAKVSDFYILRQAPCMAVLTENLFMDSPKDCAWLLTDEGRDTLAHIHAMAIRAFLPAH